MSASLVWKVPSSDGGRPITHYTVEQKGKFDIDFVKAVDTEGTELLIMKWGFQINNILKHLTYGPGVEYKTLPIVQFSMNL